MESEMSWVRDAKKKVRSLSRLVGVVSIMLLSDGSLSIRIDVGVYYVHLGSLSSFHSIGEAVHSTDYGPIYKKKYKGWLTICYINSSGWNMRMSRSIEYELVTFVSFHLAPSLLPSNVRTSCVLCVCASVPFLFVPHRLFTCISSHLFALYRKYTVGNGFFWVGEQGEGSAISEM